MDAGALRLVFDREAQADRTASETKQKKMREPHNPWSSLNVLRSKIAFLGTLVSRLHRLRVIHRHLLDNHIGGAVDEEQQVFIEPVGAGRG